MYKIKIKDLTNLIEPHFYSDLIRGEYIIETVKANKLLTHNRLDLAFKLLYLEMLDYDVDFAKEIYTDHISAFSLGRFAEPGQAEKNSSVKFIDSFNAINNSIKKNGFDSKKTVIPLSQNGTITNGAHRVASAIYFNKNVDCVKLDTKDLIYDYKFFYERNISNDVLDIITSKFIEYALNVYIAFIWPSAIGNDHELESIIPNIVYRKEIKVNPNGAHNLLSQIYYGEEWLGSVNDNFRGSQGKLVECFKSFKPIRVIVFQADSLRAVQIIKKKVRNIFNIGKHSIHITNTKDEATRTARILFNYNSIHFLNYAKPNKYLSTHKKLNMFNGFINQNKINIDKIILDSGIILSLYGLRECRDIDYLTIENNKLKYDYKEIQNHDEELQYHEVKKTEMIFNPQYHFYFNNYKFISFHQLFKMKTKRGEIKDVNDCKMMKALIEGDRFKEFFIKIRQKYYYKKIIFIRNSILFLRMIGLYTIAKNIYYVFKTKYK